MNKKPDLIKLFDLEGMVEPRRIYDETTDDISRKTPYVICGEIHLLLDMLNITFFQCDLETSLKVLQAITLRTAFLQERVIDVKNIIDLRRKNKSDD